MVRQFTKVFYHEKRSLSTNLEIFQNLLLGKQAWTELFRYILFISFHRSLVSSTTFRRAKIKKTSCSWIIKILHRIFYYTGRGSPARARVFKSWSQLTVWSSALSTAVLYRNLQGIIYDVYSHSMTSLILLD